MHALCFVLPPCSSSDYLSCVYGLVISVMLSALFALQFKPHHFQFKEFSFLLEKTFFLCWYLSESAHLYVSYTNGDFPKWVEPSKQNDDPFRSNLIRWRFLQCISQLYTMRAGLCNGWSESWLLSLFKFLTCCPTPLLVCCNWQWGVT